MKSRLCLRIVLSCLLVTSQAYATDILSPAFTAVYALKRENVEIGEMQRTLTHVQDGKYVFESVTRATGWFSWIIKDEVVERSTLVYADARVRSLEYTYDRSHGVAARRIHLSFDWNRKIVTNTIGGDAWHMSIPDDALDKLSYQISMMHDLQQQPRPALAYHIADGGTLKTYRFTTLGEAEMNTPLGRLKTIKIGRIGDKRDTVVWVAPRLQYLPVRLEQTEKDGSTLSMELSAVSGIPLQ